MRVRGIEDKKKLLDFFGAKGHANLVMRIVDVLDLRNDQQERVVRWTCRCKGYSTWDGTPKQVLLGFFPAGFIVLPFEELLGPMEMPEIQELQAVIYAYRDVRRGKGWPVRVDPCECGGRVSKCKKCMGTGQTMTFLEMSDEEREMARGQ